MDWWTRRAEKGQTFSSGAHIHARRKKAIQSAKKKKKIKKAKQKHSNAEFIEEERVVSWKQGSKTKITWQKWQQSSK